MESGMADISDVFSHLSGRSDRHSAFEDAQGILAGAFIASLGLFFMGKAHLVTSGMAGAAFLLHYVSDLSFGLLFFLVNLPFYVLAFYRMGLAFTLKTFGAVALTSVLADLQNRYLAIGEINPFWAALIGGILLGFGLLALYRHRASLGGVGILAIYIQDHTRFRAGQVQMAFDFIILAFAFVVAPLPIALASVLGAGILNVFVMVNHRSDRYSVVR
jgi:uncharacterized membrane-anchored protein YitT (DUF2179 family)